MSRFRHYESAGFRGRLGATIFIGAAFAAIAAAAAIIVVPAARAEDVAICVGVNKYPRLRPGANLNGCVNDAHLFARKLEQFGFHNPVVLADGEGDQSGNSWQDHGLEGAYAFR